MRSRIGARALLAARQPLRQSPAPRLWRGLATAATGAPAVRLERQRVSRINVDGRRLRCYATEAAEAPAAQQAEVVLPPLSRPISVPGSEELRSVLKDTQRMLANDIGGSAAWYERVKAADADLGTTRRPRLAVFGDKIAAPHDVVSALLQDPLSDSEQMRTALLDRYYGTGKQTLFISLADRPMRTDGRLAAPSSWMHASGSDVVEIAPGHDAESQLIACDATALVIDPVRLATAPCLAHVLPLALGKGHVQFIVNGPLPPNATEESLRKKLAKQVATIAVPTECKPYKVAFVQAEKALHAYDALASALSSSGEEQGRAFDTFQHEFIASNVGPLQTALKTLAPADPQMATAASTARLALGYTSGVVASDRDVMRDATDVVSDLRHDAHEGAAKARRLSVVSRGSSSALVDGSVDASIRNAKHDLEQLFRGRLSWLAILGRLRVDDVNGDIGGYIARTFARDIEQQLVFEAGQLSQLQAQLGKDADKTARTLTSSSSERAGHPFSSPVLLNHLSSLALAIPPVQSRTLLPPVATRRAQLVGTAVPRLQVTAQRALGSSLTLALAGAAGAWTAYVPPAGFVSGATAVGLGALAIVSSLALGQAWWARGQRRFWKDWNRVTAMLKDDLAANYDKTVENLVLARPNITAEGLQDLVSKREDRLTRLEQRIDALEARVQAIAPELKDDAELEGELVR